MKLHTQVKLLAAVMMAAGSFNCALAAEIEGGATTTATPMSSKLGMVTQKRLNAAHSDKANWLHVNGGYEQTRYSPAARSIPAMSPSCAPRLYSRQHWSNRWKPHR